MNTTLLIESQYFPPIPVFALMSKFAEVLLEEKETFQKSSFRNRCWLYNANGLQTLTVPLKSGRNQKKIINEIEVDHTYDWTRIHWNSIQSAYGRSPYFEFYADSLQKVLFQRTNHLLQLNLDCLIWVTEQLQWTKAIDRTTLYQKTYDTELRDMRSKITPRALHAWSNINMPVYQQTFEEKHGFIPNLSILDLIFNKGPEANVYLQRYSDSKQISID